MASTWEVRSGSSNRAAVEKARLIAGKVWSEEHGHYHDINPSSALPQQNLNIPRPEGPAPEGKVWSEEHGHWHDIQK